MAAEARNGAGGGGAPEGSGRPAPVILERYRLVRQLGEGGMGTVYEAVHIHLGSRYAVKALRPAGPMPPDQMAEMEKRFLREAKICVAVKHQNLVPVTDFGTTQGVPYIVMDFIDGEDLQHVVDREGALGEQHSLNVLHDVASALGALHEKGIIHRDMKPANIMIERKSGRVVLTDLGIAKDSSSSANLTQGILGTPAYMAPEQVMDTSSTGPESDVYGLGATFYTTLTGKRPFEGETAITIIQAARENLFAYGSIAGVSENRDGVRFSPGVHQLLHDMTTYERKDRLSSMAEVVARAETILAAAGGGGRKAPTPDELTLHLEGGKAPQAAPRPETRQQPTRQQPTRQRPARQARDTSRSAARPEPSVIAALSAVDTAVPPRRGGKGGIVAALLVLLAAAGGGGFLAVHKKWVVIPGLNAPKPPKNGGGEKPSPGGKVAGGGAEKPDPGVKTAGGGKQPGTTDPGALRGQSGGGGTTTTTPAGDGGGSADVLNPDEAPKVLRLAFSGSSDEMDGGAKPLEVVLVPPGKFRIGTPDGDSDWEKPSVEVEFTRAFYIGRHEVTVGQYAAFLTARPPREAVVGKMDLEVMKLVRDGDKWSPGPDTAGGVLAGDLPIQYVPHVSARKFCTWVSEETGLAAELPGEIEWEYVARGPRSPIYPWGNDWEEGLACAEEKCPRKVGSFPDGKSWVGALDMVGNVFEWTADEFVERRYEKLEPRDPAILGHGSSSGLRVIRGGCYGNDDYVCRPANRMAQKGSARMKALGFRIKVKGTRAVLVYVANHPDAVGNPTAVGNPMNGEGGPGTN